MKNKFLKPVKIIFPCVIVVLLCFGLYYFIDTVLNGSFIDWFEKNYMITEYKYITEAGQSGLVREPNYQKLKILLLSVLTVSIVVWLIAAIAIAHFYSEVKAKRTLTQTAQMIRRYMNKEGESADIFPKEYAEISAQMVEIKAAMERHEQTLKEEAARRNDLIAYLAHDLKTPLTSVMGYLSLLDEAPDMPPEQKAKYIHIALNKANRLERLINEFFEITRYNLQQIELDKENIDLYYMLVQMTDEFYPLLQQHGNKTELDMDENMTVYGDAAKLARVFNNILKNAIAYSYPDTTIKIRAEEKDSSVHIHFQNRGRTIPPNKLNSIFEKFYRLDEARATDTGGAGLGLAIAKEIISLHGGSITARSEDERTTFSISLPLNPR